MTGANRCLALAFGLVFVAGCYCSHVRTGATDGSVDATIADDGSAPAPCVTGCDPPRVLAQVPLDLLVSRDPAVLDMVVHRDELVLLLLQSQGFASPDPSGGFSLVRISRRTGEVRWEVVDAEGATSSIGAGALASHGESLTVIATRSANSFPELVPEIVVARWEGAIATPMISEHRLTDAPQEPCAGCLGRGAAAVVGDDRALVALGGDGELFVGHAELDADAFMRETIPMPGVVPNTALLAHALGSGVGVLAVGGLRDAHGAIESPALAIPFGAESRLDAPIALPGASSDSVPHPWLHGGGVELVRFIRDEGLASGRLHRFALAGSEVIDLGTVATAGDLPPLAMASTESALVWVESSLASVGEADLRILAAPDPLCSPLMPASVAHLPTPLAILFDTRVLGATEADGRTYVAFIEQEPMASERATLVVVDLGACRAT